MFNKTFKETDAAFEISIDKGGKSLSAKIPKNISFQDLTDAINLYKYGNESINGIEFHDNEPKKSNFREEAIIILWVFAIEKLAGKLAESVANTMSSEKAVN